ncbi:MAG: hypothetical protein ACLQOO_10630 [Terriglobia bacterium]
MARLKAIDPRTEQALVANVVDSKHKPYFDALKKHLALGALYAGFKMIRSDDDEKTAGATPSESADETNTADQAASEAVETDTGPPPAAKDQETSILHWFFFPLTTRPGGQTLANLVAWETTSASGRATYFFRLVPPEQAAQLQDPSRLSGLVAEGVQQLNQAIVLLNFRREPIYLPDESLDLQPRFHRYVIARRKIPELQRLRNSFLGRAIHTSPEAWQKQFESYLAKG